MFIQEMTERECLRVLAHERFGRLGCVRDNQPYIVPIFFVFEEPFIYSFTTPGLKIDWMRANPLVCVELDQVEADDRWMSIVVFGRYEELEEPSGTIDWDPQARRAHPPGERPTGLTWTGFLERERLQALELLQRYAGWWEVGTASAIHRNPDKPVTPVFYRISIDRITGRRATPQPSGSVALQTPLPPTESRH